ncbi:hypothetical protein ACFYRJ_17480 [Streptomyces sp. NPDC005531]|uniref:hypothetical protein n=1 Tax=Streptomyces sp. NPDC005531 TaxID=3364722 RepID=UPI0036830B8A
MFSADDFHPLPLTRPDEHAAAARTEAAELLAAANAEAKKIREAAVAEAHGLRNRAVASANGEASKIREAAQAETAKRQKRDDHLDTWSARAVIAGAVGLTASGEFELAKMVGFDSGVAWLLPLVIDVYVIQAFRRHRDVMQAIGLTIAANVIYHLADAGLFGVDPGHDGKTDPKWWLIAIVASVASLILWRMHTITAPPKAPRERRQRRAAARQEAPAKAASLPRQEQALKPTKPATEAPTTSPAKSTTSGDKSERQETTPAADKSRQKPPATTPTTGAKKTPAKPRQKQPAGKAPRRSMTEWVQLSEPIFHAEFKRLKRNPTASEFADALGAAGHGRPSDSTAKNIRTEILDRAPLPALDS